MCQQGTRTRTLAGLLYVYLDRLLDNAPRLVLEQLTVCRYEDELQPALQDLLKRQAVARRLGYLGVAAAHLPGGSTAIIAWPSETYSVAAWRS